MKVNSVYYDAGRLVYTFTVENLHTKEDSVSFRVNAEKIDGNFQLNYDKTELKKLKDGRYVGQTEVYTNGQTIKQGQQVPLVISKIGDIVGNWRFELPVVKQNHFISGTKRRVYFKWTLSNKKCKGRKWSEWLCYSICH